MALTVGVATILDAREIVIIVTGQHKASSGASRNRAPSGLAGRGRALFFAWPGVPPHWRMTVTACWVRDGFGCGSGGNDVGALPCAGRRAGEVRGARREPHVYHV